MTKTSQNPTSPNKSQQKRDKTMQFLSKFCQKPDKSQQISPNSDSTPETQLPEVPTPRPEGGGGGTRQPSLGLLRAARRPFPARLARVGPRGVSCVDGGLAAPNLGLMGRSQGDLNTAKVCMERPPGLPRRRQFRVSVRKHWPPFRGRRGAAEEASFI